MSAGICADGVQRRRRPGPLPGYRAATPPHRRRNPPGRPARVANWTHEDYLAAVLEREVAARNTSGAQLRIRFASFPAVRTLEGFDSDAQLAVSAQLASLGAGTFLTEAGNVVLLGPPSTDETHLVTAIGVIAARPGRRVLLATAIAWINRLQQAHRVGRLGAELTRLRRCSLTIVDEVGYLSFEAETADLFFFQLFSARYEQTSPVLRIEPRLLGLGRGLRDQAVAAAMIERLVHHADALTFKGASYRLRTVGIDTLPSVRADQSH